MSLRLIGPGEFQRKLPSTEADSPSLLVQVSRPFYIGIHEVTIAEFKAFVDTTGYLTDAESDELQGGFGLVDGAPVQDPTFTWRETGFPQSDRHPVVNVSWNDAQAFVAWLSQKEKRLYRLPTEAEWELACRAGATTYFSNGNDPEQLHRIANIADATFTETFPGMNGPIQANDGYAFTAPVGTFAPNDYGLHDMHGNVLEWCADWWSPLPDTDVTDPTGPNKGSFKVYRGGSWLSFPGQATVATRQFISPSRRDYTIGFRIVLEPVW